MATTTNSRQVNQIGKSSFWSFHHQNIGSDGERRTTIITTLNCIGCTYFVFFVVSFSCEPWTKLLPRLLLRLLETDTQRYCMLLQSKSKFAVDEIVYVSLCHLIIIIIFIHRPSIAKLVRRYATIWNPFIADNARSGFEFRKITAGVVVVTQSSFEIKIEEIEFEFRNGESPDQTELSIKNDFEKFPRNRLSSIGKVQMKTRKSRMTQRHHNVSCKQSLRIHRKSKPINSIDCQRFALAKLMQYRWQMEFKLISHLSCCNRLVVINFRSPIRNMKCCRRRRCRSIDAYKLHFIA